MKNRIVWGISVLVCLVLIIPISISFHRKYEVFSKGELVTVSITKNEWTRKGGYMHFDYNGKNYSSSFESSTEDYHIGDKIQLRYLEGYENNFLLPNFNPSIWGIAVILMLLGLSGGCVYYFIKDKNISKPY